MAWLSGRRFAAEFRTLESVSAMAFALVQGLERRDGPESVGGAVTNLPRSERPGADRGVSQSSATSFLLGVRAVRIEGNRFLNRNAISGAGRSVRIFVGRTMAVL